MNDPKAAPGSVDVIFRRVELPPPDAKHDWPTPSYEDACAAAFELLKQAAATAGITGTWTVREDAPEFEVWLTTTQEEADRLYREMNQAHPASAVESVLRLCYMVMFPEGNVWGGVRKRQVEREEHLFSIAPDPKIIARLFNLVRGLIKRKPVSPGE